MAGERVNLSGARETLLMTLYGKALESRLPHSLLGDRFADEAVRKIDYDFSHLKVDTNLGIGLAIRAKTYDVRVQDFIARNPGAIVLHLGCGLDTRIFRVDPPEGVEWFDVDFPDVIALRRKLYPSRDHYHLVGSSVTDPDWLAEVPRNRPAVVVMEGLTPYLPGRGGATAAVTPCRASCRRRADVRRLQPLRPEDAAPQSDHQGDGRRGSLGDRRPAGTGACRSEAALCRRYLGLQRGTHSAYELVRKTVHRALETHSRIAQGRQDFTLPVLTRRL
ncbi:class I SAM-dependent methyltransferase [Mesorhizobium sp. M1004]|uniref:class I SAM-dependent methyltransferase n=1 Tax=Mesorhizobium sp. M1004 TaxID=2957046 RepID=UPI003336B373